MSKKIVHELAKELGVESKDVLDVLNKNGTTGKRAQSGLEESEVDVVKAAFAKPKKPSEEKPVKKEEVKKEEVKKQEVKKEEKNVEEAPKKKNIVHVFRPQNSSESRKGGAPKNNRNNQPRRDEKGKAGGSNRPNQNRSNNRPSDKVSNQQKSSDAPKKQVNVADAFASVLGKKEKHTSVNTETKPVKEKEVGVKLGEKRGMTLDEMMRPNIPPKRKEQENKPKEQQHVNRPSSSHLTSRKPIEGTKQNKPTRNDGDKHERKPFSGNGNDKRDNRDPRGNRGPNPRHNGNGNNSFDNRNGANKNNTRKPFGRNDGMGYNKDKDEDDKKPKFAKKTSSSPAPSIDAGKPTRGKGKGKDTHKKKEYDSRLEDGVGRGGKRKVEVKAPLARPTAKQEKKEEKVTLITLPEALTIQELADKMKIQPSAIVKKLFLQGKVVTINQEIDFETAENIALEFEVLSEKEEVIDVIGELLKEDEEDETNMVKRPPVIVVMGHVDHGKTSLLDKIRNTHVTDKEAGGITQHIGAYQVDLDGRAITFLDTPGHEAFTSMRMRGANATDIAILVVAADDGVMPQTIEAISHAKAADTEIIVAINKIDKPGANIERVKQELSEYELISEDWGGSTIFVPVSAKTGEGIDDLMEMILLTADIMELKANPDRNARGIVLEAKLDKGKGTVANVLIQKGTLRVGDNITAGAAYGKVRAMVNDKGKRIKEAGPSTPVELIGLHEVPMAGDILIQTDTDKEAKRFADTFVTEEKADLIKETKSKQITLDSIFDQIKEGDLKELAVIIKADVQGSVEAMKQSLLKISNDEVVVKVIHAGVGAINESDVSLAAASNAIIIGFNVRSDASAKETADRENVDVRLYRVIYQAIEDIEAAMMGMLDPVYEEKVIGHAEIRQTFKASGVGTIAGSYVLDGIMERDCSCRITREGTQIFDGKLASLKRFKDDVKEVRAGYECGLVFENFNDLQELDQVEAYKQVEVPR